MSAYARIDPEEETHRTEKALRHLLPSARLPLENGVVRIEVDRSIRHRPAAQNLTSMLVHLLLRMKGVVETVQVAGVEQVPRHAAVPLPGRTLLGALQKLADSLNGPASRYRSVLEVGVSGPSADVKVTIGRGDGDIQLGADAWRALMGRHVHESRWNDVCPLGAHMAAAMGAAEVFKHLLLANFGSSEGTWAGDMAFSLLDYGIDSEAGIGPDIGEVELRGIAIAGAGAGGTATLYTLASFARVTGELLVVEPGSFKASNLGRYLLSTYKDVHTGGSKLESALAFLKRAAPEWRTRGLAEEWKCVPEEEWDLVVSTVDTPEARWQVQRSNPATIVDGGIMMGTLYAVLRVIPGGWCLECKHPPDPEITRKKRAAMWGRSPDEMRERYVAKQPVSREDLERLADVQGRPPSDFAELEGIPFHMVPEMTECGETPLLLKQPAQAPVLPFATTAAGVAIAAEVVKEMLGVGEALENYFAHDLRHRPKSRMKRFRPRREECLSSYHAREGRHGAAAS